MLILDEIYEGRKLYRKKITTIFRTLDKGVLISKYLFSIGMNRYEIESELYKKLKLVYLRIVNENELRKKIKYMVDVAEKNPPIKTTVAFNQAEIDFVNGHEDENIRILLMTMMCVYKYFGGEFTMSQMDMQRLAHTGMETVEYNKMFSEFMKMGYFNSYIKLDKKFDALRYHTYFKPSEELLKYTRMGESVVIIDDFKKIWVTVRKILGYEYNYYNCCDCGCLDIGKTVRKTRCDECSADLKLRMQEEWRTKTNWIHPNRKESNSEFYYGWKPKKNK